MSLILNLSTTLKLKRTSSPKKKYDVNTEETEANNKGKSETNVRSRLNTSTAKIIAAIGDLNIEEIAPAAAQPINKVLVFLSICNNFPRLELIAAPEATAGPNKPTEPPNPTVNGADINGKYILERNMFPPFLDNENRMEGMACSIGFLEMYLLNKYTNNNPIIGNIKYN